VSACREFTGVENVVRYTGGLHIVESEQVAVEVASFLEVKSSLTPSAIINTSHCTCPEAMDMIEKKINL
jgi:metal-dependent hydrolase (beta-lactamase superfamily II)